MIKKNCTKKYKKNGVWQKIKTLRLNLKMTQREFAKKLNVFPTTVTFWEGGRSMPGFSNINALLKLAEKGGVDLTKEELIAHRFK